MGLRARAAADTKTILENTEDAGWELTITNPDGDSVNVVGHTNDIGLTIDPETGIPVVGRTASASVCISSVQPVIGMPTGVHLSTSKPWLVATTDINGNALSYKIEQVHVDRTIDVMVLILGGWNA